MNTISSFFLRTEDSRKPLSGFLLLILKAELCRDGTRWRQQSGAQALPPLFYCWILWRLPGCEERGGGCCPQPAESTQTGYGPRSYRQEFLSKYKLEILNLPFFFLLNTKSNQKNVVYLQMCTNNFITECTHIQHILKTENTRIISDLNVVKTSALQRFPLHITSHADSPPGSPALRDSDPDRHWLRWLLRALLPSRSEVPSLGPRHSWGDHFPRAALPEFHEAFPG